MIASKQYMIVVTTHQMLPKCGMRHLASTQKDRITLNIKRSGSLRRLSINGHLENNQTPKTLNWLIKPHREKTEPTSSQIDLGVKEQASEKQAANNGFELSAAEEAERVRAKKGTYYHEKIILGYSAEQMCDLVGNVQKYKEFLPFCINSEVLSDESKPKAASNPINLTLLKKNNAAPLKLGEKKPTSSPEKRNKIITEASQKLVLPPAFKARLEIGYPPIRESYISNVSIIRPNMVKSISRDTRLFEFLINEWKFHPVTVEQTAVKNRPGTTPPGQQHQGQLDKSCIVEFYVSFKFRSPIYARFSTLIMDQIFGKMVNAFTNRALVLYGKPSVEPKQLMYSH